MSKASEWAEHEARKPQFFINASRNDMAWVNSKGHLTLHAGTCDLSPEEALRLAAWLKEMFEYRDAVEFICPKCGSKDIAACERDDSPDLEYICNKCDTVLEDELDDGNPEVYP